MYSKMVKLLLTFICIKYMIISVIFSHGFIVLASLDCNFDDDLCAWENEKGADFEWLRESKNTRSHETGPVSDHTTGEDGHYIYIEASDKDKGDKARLRSPVQSSGPYCLKFWYNMYGKDMGILNLYMKLNDSSETILFTRDRNIGDRNWRKAVINYNANDTHQIVIEGIRGDGSKSDIAVDDISMIQGWCSVVCDFDNGFCDWTQEDRGDFDWVLRKGPTFTENTGPESDHTTGTGQYIYIETTGKSINEEAIVVSPLQIYGKYCFSFWYYMYGAHVGSLKVELWYETGTVQTIFLREDDQGSRWIQQISFIHPMANFKIAFVGMVKDAKYRYEGDIAIDDVKMLSCQDCKNPTPNFATANSTNFQYGSVIEIKCNTGYFLKGQSLLVCESGGTWSANATCVLFDCGNRRIPNGKFTAPNGTTFGEIAKQYCDIGYTLIGNVAVTCTASGWSSTTASCKLIDCGKRTITNGMFTAPNGTTFGQTALQVCKIGHTLVGHASVNCTTSGWNDKTATCKIIECENMTIPNGRFIAVNGTTFNRTVTQVCNTGYNLVGNKTVRCTHLGWSNSETFCQSVDGENSAVIAVYVIVPVVALISAILLTVLFLRRKSPKCMKLLVAKHDIHSNRMTFPNKTYGEHDLGSKIHINSFHEDESSQSNNEYAAITDDQVQLKETSDAIYYNTTGAEVAFDKDMAEDDYDHTMNTTAHFVDESYSHVSGREANYTYDSSFNTTSKKRNTPLRKETGTNSYDTLNNCNKITELQKENEESDYDHAHAGGVAPIALEQDNYSRLNDMKINRKHKSFIDKDLGSGDEVEYSTVNKESQRK